MLVTKIKPTITSLGPTLEEKRGRTTDNESFDPVSGLVLVEKQCLKISNFIFQLTYFNAIEFVSPGVPGQALAHIAAHHVNAACVGVAMVAIQTTCALAFVHIWNVITTFILLNIKCVYSMQCVEECCRTVSYPG